MSGFATNNNAVPKAEKRTFCVRFFVQTMVIFPKTAHLCTKIRTQHVRTVKLGAALSVPNFEKRLRPLRRASAFPAAK
jgi:hypothetical protein